MAQKASGSGERQSYPEDRFDRVPRSGRVGAHRVTPRPRYVWQFVIAGLLGFALLTTAGVILVHNIGNTGKIAALDTSKKTAAPKQTVPKLDPAATVAILNGTETANLASGLGQVVTENEWGEVILTGDAETSDVKISAVFYSDPADAEAAAGLAAKLGGLSTYTTQDYADLDTKLVVLLGSDYQGPGLEEAKKLAAAEGDAPTAPTGEEAAKDPAADQAPAE